MAVVALWSPSWVLPTEPDTDLLHRRHMVILASFPLLLLLGLSVFVGAGIV